MEYLTHSLIKKSEALEIVQTLKDEKSSWKDGKNTAGSEGEETFTLPPDFQKPRGHIPDATRAVPPVGGYLFLSDICMVQICLCIY